MRSVAAATPAGHQVWIEDERVARLDLDDAPDLVGIYANTVLWNGSRQTAVDLLTGPGLRLEAVEGKLLAGRRYRMANAVRNIKSTRK